MTTIHRYAAFSTDPEGGNPAGVVLDAAALDDTAMAAIAAQVGYPETAFLVPTGQPQTYRARYFSPIVEVPFCGHATIASAVALAERAGPGRFIFVTNAGTVPVDVEPGSDGHLRATLTSVAARVLPLADADLTALLDGLRYDATDLDPALPPRIAYAGAYHPVIAVRERARLAELDYDVPALTALTRARDWTTIQLVHREAPDRFAVRNPGPGVGILEDPATGAAAAALGGYLRELGLAQADAVLHLAQGDDMGRPSRLTVQLRTGEPGVRVSGTAVPISG